MEPMDILLSENHLPNMSHFSNLPKLVDGNICRTPSSFSVIKKHMVSWNSESFQSNPVAFNSLNDIQMYYPKHIPMKLWFLLFARFLFYHPRSFWKTRSTTGSRQVPGRHWDDVKWPPNIQFIPKYKRWQALFGYFLDFETQSVTKCSMFVTQRVVQTYGWKYEIYKKRAQQRCWDWKTLELPNWPNWESARSLLGT